MLSVKVAGLSALVLSPKSQNKMGHETLTLDADQGQEDDTVIVQGSTEIGGQFVFLVSRSGAAEYALGLQEQYPSAEIEIREMARREE